MLHLTSQIFAIFIFETMQCSWAFSFWKPADSCLLSTLSCSFRLNCSAMQLLFAASTMHHKVPGSPIHFSVLSAFLVQIEQDLQSSTELIFICSANLMRLVPAKNHWANIMCKYFLSFRCLFACSLETLRSCRMDHPCTSPSVGGWIGSILWLSSDLLMRASF